MAKRRSPQTQAKRQREIAKKQKRQEKQERRALRKQQKAETGSSLGVIPPDESGGSDEAPVEPETASSTELPQELPQRYAKKA